MACIPIGAIGLQSPSTLFENLPFGDYVFSVRAKVGNAMTTNVASYSFSIEKTLVSFKSNDIGICAFISIVFINDAYFL